MAVKIIIQKKPSSKKNNKKNNYIFENIDFFPPCVIPICSKKIINKKDKKMVKSQDDTKDIKKESVGNDKKDFLLNQEPESISKIIKIWCSGE